MYPQDSLTWHSKLLQLDPSHQPHFSPVPSPSPSAKLICSLLLNCTKTLSIQCSGLFLWPCKNSPFPFFFTFCLCTALICDISQDLFPSLCIAQIICDISSCALLCTSLSIQLTQDLNIYYNQMPNFQTIFLCLLL